MTSKALLLAGAAALALACASAEPPHGCPPGQHNCAHNPGPMGGQMSGPQAHGAPGWQGSQGWQGGPGWNKGPGAWQWQDNRGSWHRDHDRYWRPEFKGGFVARDRLFFVLRQHRYTRFDGDPYWFQGRFVIKSFDRWGRPVFVELNPYTGDFIGVVRF
jgi:hypothetical protein